MTLAAKVDPRGYVAQRLTSNGEPRWVLTFLDPNEQLAVRLVDDDEAEQWPNLTQA